MPKGTAKIVAGRIVVEGQDMTAATARQWREIRGHSIALVFQDPLSFLNPVMRIGRQIAESIKLHDKTAAVQSCIDELLELLHLHSSVAIFRVDLTRLGVVEAGLERKLWAAISAPAGISGVVAASPANAFRMAATLFALQGAFDSPVPDEIILQSSNGTKTYFDVMAPEV